jgi:chromosome segregation ATPase
MVRFKQALVFALAASIPVLASAAAPDKAEKVAQGLLKFDQSIATAKTQLNTTIASMNALKEGGDLTAKYKTFTKDVGNLDKMSQTAKTNAQKAAQTRDQYIEEWKKSQEAIANPQLKASSEARRAELQPKIEEIKTSLGAARDTFTPLLQDLKDLTVFLANQLNQGGIASAADIMAKATADSEKVKANLDKGSAAVKDLATSIAPAGGTPTK